MKLSKQKIKGGLLSNSPTYSLFALFIPLTLLTAFIFLAQALLAMDLPTILFILSGFIGALSASFYCDFMKDKKSSRISANIRGAIITMAVSYFLISPFLFGIHRQERFIPNPLNVLACICTLYAWINVISLKQLFKARKYFETLTESYQGEQLQEILFEDSALLLYTSENINKIWQNHIFQLILIFVLTFTCTFFSIRIPPALYLLLIIILANGVFIFGFFEIIKREHYYASEGICPSGHGRIRRIMAIFIFTLFCFSAAIFLTSDKNILPISIITGFFILLIALIGRITLFFGRSKDTEFIIRENPPQEFYPYMDEGTVSPILESIVKYGSIILKYGFIILAAVLFIRFMISPLLNRSGAYKDMTFRQKLIRIIKEWFTGMLAAINSAILHLKSKKTGMKLVRDKENIRRTSENILNAYSLIKKRDIYSSVTLFARLIIWGNKKRNVKWRPSLAPGEYCSILSCAPVSEPENEDAQTLTLQQINEGIVRCGEIFEKALYSEEALSSLERKEYKKLVETITSC